MDHTTDLLEVDETLGTRTEEVRVTDSLRVDGTLGTLVLGELARKLDVLEVERRGELSRKLDVPEVERRGELARKLDVLEVERRGELARKLDVLEVERRGELASLGTLNERLTLLGDLTLDRGDVIVGTELLPLLVR